MKIFIVILYILQFISQSTQYVVTTTNTQTTFLTSDTTTNTHTTLTSTTTQFRNVPPGVDITITVPELKVENTLTILALCTIFFFIFFLFIIWLRNNNLKTIE